MTSRAENLRGGKDDELVVAELDFVLPDEPIFKNLDIIGRLEKDVFAKVPLELIQQEQTAVRNDHVDDIATSMESINPARGKKTGQLEPILLGHIPDVGKFLIINGFHRDAALRLTGEGEALARIIVNSSYEEVRDLRIKTAVAHKEVEFARRVAWMNESWADTPWADLIKPDQAFGLLNSTAQNPGSGLGLTPEQVVKIRSWAQAKSDIWEVPASRIQKDLVIARDASPELVQESRSGKEGALSPSQLDRITQAMPGARYFEHQRLAAEFIKKNKLSDQQVVQLVLAMAMAETPEEAKKTALRGRWHQNTRKSSGSKTARTASPLTETPPEEDASEVAIHSEDSKELIDIIFMDELELARQSLEIAVLRGNYTPPLDRTAKGNFGVFQSNAVPLEIGLNGHHEWSGEVVEKILSRSEQVQPKMIEYVTKSYAAIEANTAVKVYQNAIARLLADGQKGILRMFPLEDQKSIDQAIINAVRQEATDRSRAINNYVRRGGQLAPMPPTEINDSDRPIEEYGTILKNLLVSLDSSERRALMLGGVFNLPTVAIASVMGQHPSYIESVIKDLKRNVELRVEAVLDARR